MNSVSYDVITQHFEILPERVGKKGHTIREKFTGWKGKSNRLKLDGHLPSLTERIK